MAEGPEGRSPPAAGSEARRMLRTLAEGKRYEEYVEGQLREMRVCALCERVYYRRKPMKKIGARFVCIDCLRELKETLDTLDRWEEMSILNEQIEKKVHGALKR
jgi:hypothetical protein